MHYQNESYKYITTINHQNVVFTFAAVNCANAASNEIYNDIYFNFLDTNNAQQTSSRDSDSVMSNRRVASEIIDEAWTPYEKLDFPTRIRHAAMSLVTAPVYGVDSNEQANTSSQLTIDAPFQVLSDGQFIYLFRATNRSSILVDRFVFNNTDKTLIKANEVCYVHSQSPDVPASDDDTFAYTDLNGTPFIEPSTEIAFTYGPNAHTQYSFAVVLLPSQEKTYQQRWQIFVPASDGIIYSYSIPRTSQVLFDYSELEALIGHANGHANLLLNYEAKFQLSESLAGISALLYFQQENVATQGSENLLKNAARVLVAGQQSSDGTVAVLDFSVSPYGKLISANPEQSSSSAALALPLSNIPFWGTAIEMDQTDINFTSVDSGTDVFDKGLTIELWIKPRASHTQRSVISCEYIYDIVLDNGVSLSSCLLVIILNEENYLQVFLQDVTDVAVTDQLLILQSTTPIMSDKWVHIAVTAGGYGSGAFTLYLNGLLVQAQNFTSLSRSVGTTKDIQVLVGCTNIFADFYGCISETRLWQIERNQEQIQGYRSQPIANQTNGLLACWPMDQGMGEAIDQVSGGSLLLLGTSWVPANSPSRVSMPIIQMGDFQSVSGAILNDGNKPVQSASAPFLLDGSDGTVRLYYQRQGDNHLGVAYYNTQVGRTQLGVCWVGHYIQNSYESSANTNPEIQLIFSSLLAGTATNNASVAISDINPSAQTCVITLTSGDIATTGETTYNLTETWNNIPLKLSSLIKILNGQAVNSVDNNDGPLLQRGEVSYCYFNVTESGDIESGDVVRIDAEGIELSPDSFQDRVNPHASLIFQVTSVDVLDDGLEQSLPNEESAISYTLSSGIDTRWILDPVPSSLQNPRVTVKDAESIANAPPAALEIEGDITLEAWAYLTQNNTGQILLNYHSDNSQYALAINEHNKLVAARGLASGSEAQIISYSADSLALQNKWVHLAAAYQTSYGVHLKDNLYIDCQGQSSLNIDDFLTLEAWVKFDQLDQSQTIISKWNNDSKEQSWRLYFDEATNRLVFDTKNTQGKTTTLDRPISSDNKWHHIAAVYRPPQSQNMLYLNGQQYFNIFSDLGLMSETTIEMWLAPDVHSANEDMVICSCSQGKGTTDIFIMRLNYASASNDNCKLEFEFFDDNTQTDVRLNCSASKAQHLAVVFQLDDNNQNGDGTYYINIYVDGELSQTLKKNVDLNNIKHSTTWALGAEYNDDMADANAGYVGYMRDVRFWNTARTHQQILDYMNVPIVAKQEHLLGYWALDYSPVQSIDTYNGSSTTGSAITITNLANGSTQTLQTMNDPAEATESHWANFEIAGVQKIYIDDGTSTMHIDGNSSSSAACQIASSKAAVNIGREESMAHNYLSGTVDNVRIWHEARYPSQIKYYRTNPIDDAAAYAQLAACWNFNEGESDTVKDEKGQANGQIKGEKTLRQQDIPDVWVPTPIDANWRLYVNGIQVAVDLGQNAYSFRDKGFYLGQKYCESEPCYPLSGYLNEVRVWSTKRSKAQINNAMHATIVGDQDNLQGYWPCEDGSGDYVNDISGNRNQGYISSSNWVTLSEASDDVTLRYPVPVGEDSALCINASNNVPSAASEQVTLTSTPAAVEFANGTQRNYAFINNKQEIIIDTGFKTGEVEYIYLGQIQFEPQVVGYIEGAPPVPSENLTVEAPSNPDKYFGTCRVELEDGEEKHYAAINSFNIGGSLDLNLDLSIDLGEDLKIETPSLLGVLPQTELDIQKSEIQGNLGGFLNNAVSGTIKYTSSIDSTSTKSSKIIVDGGWENNLYKIPGQDLNTDFSDIQSARIYRPNNMGAAIVKSRSADFFAIKSKKTGATLDYTAVPDGSPEDVNIIMFRLNPLYIKNGTLDGYIGFDQDIQYTALDSSTGQKGSYFKAQEAYSLKKTIEKETKQWESYFDQRDISHVEKDSHLSNKEWQKKHAQRSMVNTYVWAADGGLFAEEQQYTASRREAFGVNYDLNTGINVGVNTKDGFGAIFKILTGFSANALGTFKFQLEMSRASRDTESFSLKSSVEGEGFLSRQMNNQVILVTAQGDASDYNSWISFLNGEAEILPNDLQAELISNSVLSEIPTSYGSNGETESSTNQYSVSKNTNSDISAQWVFTDIYGVFAVTESTSTSYTLEFTPLPGDRDKGQYPINYQASALPGKVTDYRFMSFYLDPSDENIDALFDDSDPNTQIIDPAWFNDPNNPDAIALKEAQNRSREAWRILHRVTYVNRVPQDTNILDGDKSASASETLSNKVHKPDAMSLGNNYLVIELIMGHLLDTSMDVIDPDNPDFAVVSSNIHKLLDSLSLYVSANEREHMYELMMNYFTAYLATDALVTSTV